MFKDLDEGALVHIVDATNIPIYYQGILSKKGPQYIPQPLPGQQFNPMMQVFDLVVSVNGSNQNFKGVPCVSEIATHDGMTLSCSQSALKPIVDDIYRKSINAIRNIDKEHDTKTACESIFEQIDPNIAKSKEQEKKIADLQNQLSELQKGIPTLEDIKAIFTQSQNSNTNIKKDK